MVEVHIVRSAAGNYTTTWRSKTPVWTVKKSIHNGVRAKSVLIELDVTNVTRQTNVIKDDFQRPFINSDERSDSTRWLHVAASWRATTSGRNVGPHVRLD